jgi:plasmid maintenance system antidote protein VapI
MSFNPDWVSPPGDTIRDILEERGLTRKWLAINLNINEEAADLLLVGGRFIDESLAAELARLFGPNAKFWLERERHYREDSAKQQRLSTVTKGAFYRVGQRWFIASGGCYSDGTVGAWDIQAARHVTEHNWDDKVNEVQPSKYIIGNTVH